MEIHPMIPHVFMVQARGHPCRHGLRIGEDAFDHRQCLAPLGPQLEDEVEDLVLPRKSWGTGLKTWEKGGKLQGNAKTLGGKHGELGNKWWEKPGKSLENARANRKYHGENMGKHGKTW